MIRALALLALVACKSDKPPAPKPHEPDDDHARASLAEIDAKAAAKLPGELWFVDEGADGDGHGHGRGDVVAASRRVLRLRGGDLQHLGRGSEAVFGALYPTSQRLADGRVVAIASHGDGRADGEQLVLISDRGSIATFGPAALQVRDPAASPDGAWIVVAMQGDDGVTNLQRIDAATGKATPLTTNREGNFTPVAISSEAIAFVSSRDGDSEVYKVNVDGTKLQRLTAFHREDLEPAIDASGQQLAFTSDREQLVPRIFVVKPDGTGVHRLTRREDKDVEEGQMVWSPRDARRYAYSIRRGGLEQLVVGHAGVERVITPADAMDSEVTFSPDGAWLAVVRRAPANRRTELVAVPLDGGAPIVVARGAVRTPRWF